MINKIENSIVNKDFSGGLNTISDIFILEENESPDSMDVKFNFDGSMEKREGYNLQGSVADGEGLGVFDFGTGDNKNLIAAVGTGALYSTDLGASWTNILTSKAAQITYFERIKDYAVLTDRGYEQPFYWTGSAADTFVQMNSAPYIKFMLDFQGYALGLNDIDNALKVFYEDQNTFLSGDWGNYFTLPASRSDGITGGVVIRNKAYIFTKYKIFRVTYVGGNPDFTYTEVKNFGFVEGAWDKVSLPEVGEVVVGLSYDKRIRLFDGSDDKIISDKIEKDNGMSDFALENLNATQIHRFNSVTDTDEQEWKLNVAVNPSDNLTHTICLNLRSLAYYVYNYSTPFQSMTMTESNNLEYLVGLGSDGSLYLMNSGNTDAGASIDEHYISPFIFSNSPSRITKGHKMDFYFAISSANDVYIETRPNFDNTWRNDYMVSVPEISSSNQIARHIDIPYSFNTLQYKVSSSSGTQEGWKLNRVDGLLKGKGYGKA